MRVLVMLFISLLGLTTAIVYEDLDLEAVIIDDDPDDEIELEQTEDLTTTLAPEGTESCTSSNGIRGTCMKFKQCFPFSETLGIFQLSEILNESTTPCEGGDKLICCLDYHSNIPIRKPQFEGMTSEKPSSSVHQNTTDAPDVDAENCGANHYKPLKVVGGRKAEIGEFPFAVPILNKGKQFCAGSLISRDWVLTAAHCIVNLRSFSSISVNLGDNDVSKPSEVQHQPRGIKKALYNKHFSMRTLEHDIALLQLDKPADLNDQVQPVCLSSDPPPYEEKAVLAGWGKTGKNLPPSTVLRTVTMRIIPQEECQENYAKDPNIPQIKSGMVCAGEGSQGQPHLKDACFGDSGGPLSLMATKKATQIGIVSFGKNCGDLLAVYTRVDKYLTWINKVQNTKRS